MGFPHGQHRVKRAQQVMGKLRRSSGLIGIVLAFDQGENEWDRQVLKLEFRHFETPDPGHAPDLLCTRRLRALCFPHQIEIFPNGIFQLILRRSLTGLFQPLHDFECFQVIALCFCMVVL